MSILFKKGVKKFQTGGGFSPLGTRLKPFVKTDVGANLGGKTFKDANDMSGSFVSNNPGKSVFLANVQLDPRTGRGKIPVNTGGGYEIGISSDRPFSVADTLYQPGQHRILHTANKTQDLEVLFDPDKKAKVFGVLHMLRNNKIGN